MKPLFRTICMLACAGLMLAAQTPFSTKPGVQREQLQKIMPDEVRATVRLYLEDKIRQWYSRSDGKGVIVIVNAMSIADAETVIDALPLSKASLVDYEYTAPGPLASAVQPDRSQPAAIISCAAMKEISMTNLKILGIANGKSSA